MVARLDNYFLRLHEMMMAVKKHTLIGCIEGRGMWRGDLIRPQDERQDSLQRSLHRAVAPMRRDLS